MTPMKAVKRNEVIQFQVGDEVSYVNGVLRKQQFGIAVLDVDEKKKTYYR